MRAACVAKDETWLLTVRLEKKAKKVPEVCIELQTFGTMSRSFRCSDRKFNIFRLWICPPAFYTVSLLLCKSAVAVYGYTVKCR